MLWEAEYPPLQGRRSSSARRKGSTGPGFLQNGGTIERDLHKTSGAGFLETVIIRALLGNLDARILMASRGGAGDESRRVERVAQTVRNHGRKAEVNRLDYWLKFRYYP